MRSHPLWRELNAAITSQQPRPVWCRISSVVTRASSLRHLAAHLLARQGSWSWRALSLGGSCSGEYSVGLGKREFLEQEHGAEALAVMRSIKQGLDPLNPGKIFLN
jgi:FAD/FMN-containing dehydrogenase